MKTAVLLSGGVDSSVALNLVKDAGHDVTAFYLKIWLQDEFSYLGDCPWEEDLKYAQAICKQAGVPLEVVSLQTEYWDYVVSYTIDEIKRGNTPNPDIFCNSLIKFGLFYDKIDDSYKKVVSGHYAKVCSENNKYILKKSPDLIKDQTYFLAYLKQSQLSRALFPLGDLKKEDVRNLAHKYDLPTQDRKDSQGICFLGKIKFSDFIKHHLGVMTGEIIDIDTNSILGEHNGFYYYTIGQRSGLGLSGGPWYVVNKDTLRNIIYVSKENLTERFRNKFLVNKFNWISGERPWVNHLQVKIRHGENFYDAVIEFIEEDEAEVKISKPDQGIAPGQFAVFYKEDMCLGGGIIKQIF